jgi:hypothetical protein
VFPEAHRLGELMSRTDTIVFVGAGVSNWSGLPTWWELLQRLAEFLVENGRSAELVERELANNDLLMAASFGFHQLTRHERCEFLRRHCHVPLAAPGELHSAIVGLPARCFITTNYDGLLERALREHRPGEYFDVVTPLQQIEIANVVQAKSEGFVFKPHGDIASCDSIVLTREDYREMQGARRNVLEAMRTLLVSRPVLFVGFGLRDPDFLLVRDLISSAFGASPGGHYALIPDVLPTEVDYWNRSYGIRVISYTTDASATGPERHRPVLSLIKEIAAAVPADPMRTISVAARDRSSTILALARHARRLQSQIGEVADPMPISMDPIGKQASSRDVGGNAIRALTRFQGRMVVEGPPGSGKTFAIRQAVRLIARSLEDACLSDPDVGLADLRVPVIIECRDYDGSIVAMVERALPPDVRLADLLAARAGVFFLDGVNEAPSESYEDNRLQSDLASFLETADANTVVLATRFGDDLQHLMLPTYALDRISSDYVRSEIDRAGLDPATVNPDTLRLLERPLYFAAWKSGRIEITHVTTVHEVYSQLVDGVEREAREWFELGDLRPAGLFGRIAYSMIDAGELSASLAQVHAELRPALRNRVDTNEFVNFLIANGVLVATPMRRLAFFHHSVAEYFAAGYLARLIEVDGSVVRHCLSRHAFDQVLLLALDYLETNKADAVFEQIMSVDAAMALRALDYLEDRRWDWTRKALRFLATSEISFDHGIKIGSAFSRLRVGEDLAPELLAVVEAGGSLGGHAAALLWRLSPQHRSAVLDLICDPSRGFNFLARLTESLGDISTEEVYEVLRRIERIPLDDKVVARLRLGDEVDEFVGLIHGAAEMLRHLPVHAIAEYGRATSSLLVKSIVCDALDRSRDPEAIRFVEQCVLNGEDFALSALYFQVMYGHPKDQPIPRPSVGLVASLTSAMCEGRQAQWVFPVLHTIVNNFPDLASELRGMPDKSPFWAAAAAFLVGDLDKFFALLEKLAENGPQYPRDAVEALTYVEIDWQDRASILVSLLRLRDLRLAGAILPRLRHSNAYPSLRIGLVDVEWWLEWLQDAERSNQERMTSWGLGDFLALGTDDDTQTRIVECFETNLAMRETISELILPKMAQVTLESLSRSSVDWLVAQLGIRKYSTARPSPLARMATEEFVQSRLLPLLIENPSGLLRNNLVSTLESAGRSHRRRYIDETGELVG